MITELAIFGIALTPGIIMVVNDDPRLYRWLRKRNEKLRRIDRRVRKATRQFRVALLACLLAPVRFVACQWRNTVGAWFARRRFVAGFYEPRRKLHRIGHPDEHSRGIMVARRDVNTGWWS